MGHLHRGPDDDRANEFLGELPARVYPTHLRGTGESFAANVGGRMIGTFAALITVQLVNVMPGGSGPFALPMRARSSGRWCT